MGFESQAARLQLFVKPGYKPLQRRPRDPQRQVTQAQIEQLLVSHSIQFFYRYHRIKPQVTHSTYDLVKNWVQSFVANDREYNPALIGRQSRACGASPGNAPTIALTVEWLWQAPLSATLGVLRELKIS